MSPLWFLLSAAFLSSAIAADPSPAEVIERANEVLGERGLGEVATPDLSFSTIFGEGSISNVRQGKLDSLVPVQGVDQNLVVEPVTPEGIETALFNFTVALQKFYVSYDYKFTIFGWKLFGGSVLVTADKNSGEIIGAVARNSKRNTCQAVVQKAELLTLGSFTATIQPRTLFNRMVATVIQFTHNWIVSSDVRNFNDVIQTILASENFTASFSDVACASLGWK